MSISRALELSVGEDQVKDSLDLLQHKVNRNQKEKIDRLIGTVFPGEIDEFFQKPPFCMSPDEFESWRNTQILL